MEHGKRGRHAPDEEFIAYYAARAGQLRNTAFLLCGDWHLAEDLTQIVVTKLYQAWHRIERHDTLDQYARRVLLRAFLDERRRPWRREVATEPDGERFDHPAAEPATDERLVLHQALLQVPKGRRAVLVLRFWADLSVDQVADILGCTAGTVKSQTSAGLADLRRVLGGALNDLKRPAQGGPR